jgi:putative exporter of polyketide antibiotics
MYTQQQNFWITPYAATATPETGLTAGASSSGSFAGPGAIPASVYAQQQGNPALQATQTPTPTATSSSPTSGNTLLQIILVAIVIAGVAVVSLIITKRTKRKQQQSSAARVEFP